MAVGEYDQIQLISVIKLLTSAPMMRDQARNSMSYDQMIKQNGAAERRNKYLSVVMPAAKCTAASCVLFPSLRY